MTIKLGKYQHFKGSEYQVIHVGRHSETEEYHVIYYPLYGEEDAEDKIWIRPLSMFDDTIERQGKLIKRFKYVANN